MKPRSKRSLALSDRMASYHWEVRMTQEPMPTPQTHPNLGWRLTEDGWRRPMRMKDPFKTLT